MNIYIINLLFIYATHQVYDTKFVISYNFLWVLFLFLNISSLSSIEVFIILFDVQFFTEMNVFLFQKIC